MSIMLIIAFIIFAYEAFSLVLPLKIHAGWKALYLVLLLTASFKNTLFQKFGGGMFFAPDLPRWVMLVGSLFYNLLVLALFLAIFKDVLWVLWKLCIRSYAFPSGAASSAVLAAATVLTLYGTWEALRVPDVERHDVFIPNLPQEFEGTKAALLVDLHASALNRRPLIQAIVEKTNALSPDIILIPGDFVDGWVKDRKDDLEPLNRLRASLGVYGTSGNHEYYSGYEDWLKQLTAWGITMLENRHVIVTSGSGRLVIAGVPDQQGARFGFAALRLSGHTHGGMMPVLDKIVARFNSGYVRGWYDVGSMKLYVSRGTSLWNGFPMRLLDPAEITLFVLHGDKSK